MLSQVPAGQEVEDNDTKGFVGAPVTVPSAQLAKNVSEDAEYDPFKYTAEEKKSEVKQVDEKTLGSLVGLPKPTPVLATPMSEVSRSSFYSAMQSPVTQRSSGSRAASPSESGFHTGLQTPIAETPTPDSAPRTVSQLNLPTISAVTAENKEGSSPPTPKVAHVEVMSPVASPKKASRSDSHDSRHGSVLSDSSGPSIGSADSHSHESDDAGPSTPDEETASPFTPGLKELFAAESPRVTGETNTSSETEKLRRPQPPARTASQLLTHAEED